MHSIKRYVLFLAPQKVLVDWSNYIFEGTNTDAPNPLEHDNADVFLIPQFDCIEDAMEWLEANYETFFERQLELWCTDPEQWPKDRTWGMFQKWFYVSIQSCVYDALGSVPILKEESF